MQPFVSQARRSHVRALATGVFALLLGAACGGAPASPGPSALPAAKLALVAYSTPQEAYEKIFTAFQKTSQGGSATFSESYGASGDQSRAVESGLPADVVAFSLEPDITRLVNDGIVAKDWNTDRYKGFITESVVVLAVRKGQPQAHQTWDDLLKPGVQVLVPIRFTSGGARWDVLAAYLAKSGGGKDDAAGLAYLNQLFPHVAVQDASSRNALQTFANGKGDVLISYQNEAIFVQQHGQALDYVIPDGNILIQNPVAVTTRTKSPEQARAFDRFPGQQVVDTLIDMPFALPTIVAGLVPLTLYGPVSPVGIDLAYQQSGVVVALLFVTLPFVVRTVQPVLLELDREMEQARPVVEAPDVPG